MRLCVGLSSPFTLDAMSNHSVACIPSVNHEALVFLSPLQPDHLVAIVHVRVAVLCRVDMSVLGRENEIESKKRLPTLGTENYTISHDPNPTIVTKKI